MRHSVALALAALVACGGSEPSAPPVPALDTRAAERPDGVLFELEIDDESTLESLAAALPEDVRGGVPSRLVDVVESEITLPAALRRALSGTRGLRAIALDDDGEVALVVAFGLAPLEDGALGTEPGAPRGARWVTGEPIAIAGDVAVAGPSRALVEVALPYLAFTALPRAAEDGRVSFRASRAFLVEVLRPRLDEAVTRTARDARRSAEAATAAHAAPPALGAPERFVDRVRARLASWIALLPDVRELAASLGADDEGLSLALDLEVEASSPLGATFAAMPPVPLTVLASAPESAALALVLGSTVEERAGRTERLLADLTDVAGERLGADERARLAARLSAWDAALGARTLVAFGRSETGPISLLASPDAAAPLPDALFAPFWGPDAEPWVSALLGLFAGCEVEEPGRDARLCAGRRLSAAHDAAPGLVVAVAPDDAGTVAADVLGALRAERALLGASPDVARALALHEGEVHFALVVVPSRLLPLLAALEGRPSPLDAPPASVVVSARPTEHGVRLLLTAPSQALADAEGVARMFAGP